MEPLTWTSKRKMSSSNLHTAVLFLTIQFSIRHLFAHSLNVKHFYLIHSCYHSSQSGPRSNGNERVHHIPQSSSITGASPLDYLLSYPGHLLRVGGLVPLQRCSQCILQPQLSRLKCPGNDNNLHLG